MTNLDLIPPEFLSHEHYRQMMGRDYQRRYAEWHGEYLRHQNEFLNDQQARLRERDELRNRFYEENKRRTSESRQEFLRYQNKYLAEMRRY